MIYRAAIVPPFLLGDSYGAARMGIPRLFGFCAAFLFASSVTASTIDVGPSDWRNYGPNGSHTAQGVKSSFGQNVRLPPTISGPTRVLPVSRNPVIPYGSIANGAKNFLRVSPQSVAASAAITALFMGLDWVFDDELDSWMKEGIEEAPPGVGTGWRASSGFLPSANGITYSSAEEACQDLIPNHMHNTDWQYVGLSYQGAGNFGCVGVRPPSSYQQVIGSVVNPNPGCPAPYQYNPNMGRCEMAGVIDLDPSDWSELEASLPSANPQQVATSARDIQQRIGNPLPGYTDTAMTGPSSVTGPETTSTSTDPVTGETTVTNTSTETYISYGDTTITTTNTTTSTTYENGQQTGETVTTETPGELPVDTGGGGASGDWPGFCEWASVVCDWFNWTQEEPPPEQDLPAVVDDDFYQEKTISFGAKSCPPDHQIDLTPFLSTSVAVSFQPLCDFAGLIYYMVMAASYIIAAYITIGVARNG